MASLTKDAVRDAIGMGHSKNNPSFKPIVQVISIKNVGGQTNSTRYRTIISDGEYFVQGMLASQINSMVENNEIKMNMKIQLDACMTNIIQGKTVLIILGITIIENHPSRIGNPVDIESTGLLDSKANAGSTGAAPVTPMYSASAPTNVGSTGNTTMGQSTNPYSPQKVKSAAPIVHRGVSGVTGGTPITSISNLNMYQNRWTIKARVTSKSDIRTWSNAKGEGSLFSIELLDSSMDIRATFFKEAVDKFYNFLSVGNVFTFSGGRLKIANIQYNTCKSNFEITFDKNSEIHLADDSGDIQKQSFSFVKIAQLEEVENQKTVDVLGVAQEIGEIQSLISKKSGQELKKCDVLILDDSDAQVRLTLWGSQAVEGKEKITPGVVVAFKRTRVSDYGGRSLSGTTSFFVEPEIQETVALQQWWTTQGSQKRGRIKSLSSFGGASGRMDPFNERKNIAAIKAENLGHQNEKGDYLCFTAHFSFFKKDKEGGAWYTACPNKEEPCRNRYKVTQTVDGNWQCDKCNGTYPKCMRKWIFSGTLLDATGSTWVSVFDEQAVMLFNGATADEVHSQFENQDIYDGHFAKALYSEWIFKCKVKNEIVNDEPRLKTQVVRMDPIDYVSESNEMANAIENFQ